MSNVNVSEAENELDEMSDEELKKKAVKEAEGEKEIQAESDEEALPPGVSKEDPLQAPGPTDPDPNVTPSPEPEPAKGQKQDKDDPLKWAEKKGFKSAEDMARALLQKEHEYHESRQKGKDEPPPIQKLPNWNQNVQRSLPQTNWTPSPQNAEALASRYEMDPSDFTRVSRLVADMMQSALPREREMVERRLMQIERDGARQKELMGLMQDPAYSDPRVQKEMHEILDADPQLFGRDGWQTHVFTQALGRLARKQLQQESISVNGVSKGENPPVTAGGGTGSTNVGPIKVNEKIFLTWPESQQKAFLETGKVPKK